MRANARTGADLELGGRAILQLYRIPHILEGDSLDLLVDVVDSLIFGLLSLVTASVPLIRLIWGGGRSQQRTSIVHIVTHVLA